MTESDWQTCTDPRLLLDQVRGQTSSRKLRWFACACVRAVWTHLLDERSQFAVEVSERFADGHANSTDLLAAEQAAFEVARLADLPTTVTDPGWAATRAAARAANLDAYSAAVGTAFLAAMCAAPWSFETPGGALQHGNPQAKLRARREQCDLVREIVGNPYRVVPLEPAWRTWSAGVVMRLAHEIYDERRFDELPVLADALEEAGCGNDDLLAHLRSPVRHVRGCWVLDLVLANP